MNLAKNCHHGNVPLTYRACLVPYGMAAMAQGLVNSGANQGCVSSEHP